jgi:hypothetical protein
MDHASTINFLSNEDTQEQAPGFFMCEKPEKREDALRDEEGQDGVVWGVHVMPQNKT